MNHEYEETRQMAIAELGKSPKALAWATWAARRPIADLQDLTRAEAEQACREIQMRASKAASKQRGAYEY